MSVAGKAAAGTLALWLAACGVAPVSAELPRGKPIRLLVAYPAGGVSDAIARALAKRVTRRSGATVIVENRGGASGAVAMAALARAPADGRTLVFSAITPLTLPPTPGTAVFDPDDVAPLMSVMSTPVLVVGTPALAANSLAEAVALAKASPGALRWATTGVATTGHVVLERVQAASGVEFTHVPYRGGGAQITDALAGQFELLSTNVAAPQLRYVREGRLTALAVGAPARLAVLPDVPTLAEVGYPAANLWSTFGLFVPARTPRGVVTALNAAFNAALRDPEIRRGLDAVNNTPTGGTAEAFAQLIARERDALRRPEARR